jgi:hypothetical protein
MGKIKIAKFDYIRVMLTEVLPYEVPINFLNEGMYNFIKDYEKSVQPRTIGQQFVSKIILFPEHTTPYNYRINKNSSSKRLLSIPHPSIQFQICQLYRDYDALIIELCNRSPISLRAPSKVASRFYEKELVHFNSPSRSETVDTEVEGFEKISAYASSYFTYRKYNFLYKFYDSYESHRIEKKFNHLTKFDISKCFHNIYTESFGWAVKSKEFSKTYSKCFSFERVFQNIMNNSNDQESSGIIIGPEFSRIFAEVILQKIDQKIIKRVKNQLELDFDTDYTLRRYVDDYFLYTKDSSKPKKIIHLIKEELEKFKLFINESKTEVQEVPFITGLTIAKMDCKDLVSDTFKSFYLEDYESILDSLKAINPSREANRFIKSMKRIVKDNNVSYESLSGYTLSDIRKKLLRLLNNKDVATNISDNYNEKVLSLITFSIEISFFIYSMDIRVRTTYIITQIVVQLNEFTKKSDKNFKDSVRKKIFDESTLLLTKMRDQEKYNSIETLNLLISLHTNFQEYPIPHCEILQLFNVDMKDGILSISDKSERLEYFQLMVLSYFFRDKYQDITQFIQKNIKEILEGLKNPLSSTENVCLLLDSMSNPYFDENFKREIISDFMVSINFPGDPNEVKNYLENREWFFTWKDENLAQILMKKELRSPY